MEEKIFELGDYSFLKKSKVQMSTLIKATIFYIVSGIVTAYFLNRQYQFLLESFLYTLFQFQYFYFLDINVLGFGKDIFR